MELFLEDPRVVLLMNQHSTQPFDPSTSTKDLAAAQRTRQQFQSLGLQHQVESRLTFHTICRLHPESHGGILPAKQHSCPQVIMKCNVLIVAILARKQRGQMLYH